MLQKSAEYIMQLRTERDQLKDEMDSLRQQIENLNTSIRYVRKVYDKPHSCEVQHTLFRSIFPAFF